MVGRISQIDLLAPGVAYPVVVGLSTDADEVGADCSVGSFAFWRSPSGGDVAVVWCWRIGVEWGGRGPAPHCQSGFEDPSDQDCPARRSSPEGGGLAASWVGAASGHAAATAAQSSVEAARAALASES